MVVNTIRHNLKKVGICHEWQNITRMMNTKKIAKTSFVNDKGKVIIMALQDLEWRNIIK